MQVEILYRPSYCVARVILNRNEKIQVESGAMVGMSPDMEMETQAKGGLLKSILARERKTNQMRSTNLTLGIARRNLVDQSY